MNDKTLEVFKKRYEEVSYMLNWMGEDGSYARTVCGLMEELLEDLGYDLNEIDWILKSNFWNRV